MSETNKSVITIDTPKSCSNCKLAYDDYGLCDICILTEYNVNSFCNTYTKPDWCPLSPIPEKIKVKQFTDNTALNISGTLIYQYAQGWNDLREKLLEGK